jgi:hypothetical protein
MRKHTGRKIGYAAMAIVFSSTIAGAEAGEPFKLTLLPENPSVYDLPSPLTKEEGINAGGANAEIKITYLSDYLFRGVNRQDFIDAVTSTRSGAQANFQFDGKLQFDLGKFPHPFIGIFANVLDSDPISTFQEVRPVYGAELRIRPLIMAAGNNIYSFPNRNELSTGEVWGKITLDDAAIFKRDEPILSPYIYGAYDYDLYNGWYIEAGVTHDFIIEKTGITITAQAAVAYVLGNSAFAGPTGRDTGFQHYELGLIGRYSLNQLLNIPARYGQWTFNGYLYYTDGLSDDLRADSQIWGGAGIQWNY